jgi:hypothetical protein
MVEAGLLIPLLVFMLIAVGFMGFAIYERENVIIAARFAAREASIDATNGGINDKLYGAGVLKAASSAQDRVASARKVLGGKRKVDATVPTWRYEAAAHGQKLNQVVPLGNFAHAYVAKNGQMGIGFIMYGQRITSKGPWLDALGKGLNDGSHMLTGRSNKLWDGLGVRAEAYMPGELPVHTQGAKVGVVDLNPWITQILNRPIK